MAHTHIDIDNGTHTHTHADNGTHTHIDTHTQA
jgi:hypothetical protein